jgi:hypothetical protein
MTKTTTQLHCACGRLQLEVRGRPIINAECHCTSCRTAGTKLQGLPLAVPMLEPNGGTHFVLYRKDRVRIVDGAHLLKEHRLTPGAKTRRVLAACCMTPVFLEFQSGHWLSLYASLWPAGALPAVDLRTMTSDLPPGTTLSPEVPSYKTQSPAFFAKLLGAWIAMGFRVPKIAVNGELQV